MNGETKKHSRESQECALDFEADGKQLPYFGQLGLHTDDIGEVQPSHLLARRDVSGIPTPV
jgi:hypothetical protein